MTQTQNDHIKKHGDRLRRNETKSEIIDFILRNSGLIREPDIRKYLKEKHNTSDQGTINKHLHKLKELGCIELILPKRSSKVLQRSGLPNRWNITNIQHLTNIKNNFKDDDCFKKIKLNIHKKSLNIISDQRGFDPGTTLGKRYRIQMFLSVSFFDICLKTEVETLYSKADEIYKLSRGGAYWRKLSPVKNPVNKLYTEFVKTILTNQNIWLDVYTECINDPLKSDICQKCFKFSKDVEISEEAFKVIVEGALPKKYVESYEELYQIMVKYISNNLASEIIAQKLSKEIHIEYIKGTNEILEEQLENMATKISEEIFNRILVETNWAETYLEMLHIINFEDEKKLISLELLFDHCFQNDIMEGTVSTEEREFVYAEQKYFEIMDIELHETLKYGIKFYDDFLNDSLEKYGLK